jgi:hypothetical protein
VITLEPFKFALWVAGWPRTKGSMKCLGARTRGGKHILVEEVTLSKPWRTHVQNCIVRHVRAELPGQTWSVYEGAVLVDAVFHYERPATGIGVDLPYPTIPSGANANGDEDKLRRNILDSLQGCGLIKNDCMVVGHSMAGVTKKWAPEGGASGVQIIVQEAP